jgi:nucleoside-diphosphate-sugar epimerase
MLGCGYVGSAVADQWLSEGKEVWGVSRNRETLSQVKGAGFHPVVAEVDSDEWHSQVPDSPAIVLNCVSSAGGGVGGYKKSYIGGNQSLLIWARNGNPGKILYTSSTTVYPFVDGRKVSEDDAGGDLAESGEIVMESERMLLEDELVSSRATVLRLAGIYGPGRHYLLNTLRECKGVLPGRGDFFMNLIFLDDIVSAVQAVVKSPRSGGRVYNVADGNSPTKEELVRWLAERINCPVPTFDPELLGGRRMRVNRAGGSPNRRVCIDRIREEIGWKPGFPSFREGFAALGV